MRMRTATVLIATVIALVAFCAGSAWGSNPFNDIANNQHEASIDAIFNAGITTGCSASAYCPNNPVTRAQMATFLARTAGLGKDNFPKVNAKGDRQSYCALARANQGSLPFGPCLPRTEVVAASGAAAYLSMAIGADNNPVIAYYSGAPNGADLMLAHCDDPDCDVVSNVTTLDQTGDVGLFPSIAIDGDGYPIVAYYDATNTALKVANCVSIRCQSGATSSTVDATGDVGRFPSIAITSSTAPAISYYDNTNNTLKLVVCVAGDCASAPNNSITVVDDGIYPRDPVEHDVGQQTSLTLNALDHPRISYIDATDNKVVVAACVGTGCSGEAVINVVGDVDPNGSDTSIVMGPDGFPVVAFEGPDFDLHVSRCSTATCTVHSNNNVTNSGATFSGVSLRIGFDGRPLIGVVFLGAGAPAAFACANADCSARQSTVPITGIASIGETAIAFGVDGVPVQAYFNNGAIRLTRAQLVT